MGGFKNSELADKERAMRPYWNSAEFLAFTNDGKMRNYDEFQLALTDYHNMIIRQKITTFKEKYIFLCRDSVIYARHGKFDAELRNGHTMMIDPYGVTMIIKKIGSEWKVIYIHDSSLPPVIT